MEPSDKPQFPITSTASNQPAFVSPPRPQSTLGYKIFIGSFWLMLLFSVLLTAVAVSAGSGAGFMLLLTVPGILISASTLAIVYGTVWITNRRQPVFVPVQAVTEGATKKVQLYTRLAIATAIVALIITLVSTGVSIFADPRSGLSHWPLLILGYVVGSLGVVGAVLTLRATHVMTKRRRYTLTALFLAGIGLPLIIGTIASPLVFMAHDSRAAGEVKELSFDPLVPADDSRFIISPDKAGGPRIQADGTLLYEIIRTSDRDNIAYPGDDKAEGGWTSPPRATVRMKKAQQSTQKIAPSDCTNQCERITTPGGIEVMTRASSRWYVHDFEKTGVLVRIEDREGMLQRNPAGMGDFIDGLKIVSPEQLAAQYIK